MQISINPDCLKVVFQQLLPLVNFRRYLLVLSFFLESQFLLRLQTRFCCSMWRHIGDNPRYVQLDEVRSSSSSNNAIKRPLASGNTVRHPLDWSSSSCGLFTGLLSLVALIINLIVYFALVNQVRIICRIPKKAQCLKITKKSRIQHCERSELRLHFKVDKS